MFALILEKHLNIWKKYSKCSILAVKTDFFIQRRESKIFNTIYEKKKTEIIFVSFFRIYEKSEKNIFCVRSSRSNNNNNNY